MESVLYLTFRGLIFGGLVFGGKLVLMIWVAYIRGGLVFGGGLISRILRHLISVAYYNWNTLKKFYLDFDETLRMSHIRLSTNRNKF